MFNYTPRVNGYYCQLNQKKYGTIFSVAHGCPAQSVENSRRIDGAERGQQRLILYPPSRLVPSLPGNCSHTSLEIGECLEF